MSWNYVFGILIDKSMLGIQISTFILGILTLKSMLGIQISTRFTPWNFPKKKVVLGNIDHVPSFTHKCRIYLSHISAKSMFGA
jgi:hypothetical protein